MNIYYSLQQFFQKLLGSGEKFGIKLTYEIQNFPEGLAQAFIIGEEFMAGSSVVLILGDNLLIGSGLGRRLSDYTNLPGATIFGKKVADPHKYGVAEIDAAGNVKSLEEKPVMPKSNLAIPGMYFFDDTVCIKAKLVKKSARGELEIISILEMYLQEDQLTLEMLPEDSLWMDCGTVECGSSLESASTLASASDHPFREIMSLSCPASCITLRYAGVSETSVLKPNCHMLRSLFSDFKFANLSNGVIGMIAAVAFALT